MESKTKRKGLDPRREPYWTRLRAGAHLGFRKLAEGEGTWIAKHRDAEGRRQYKALGAIAADGKRDPFDIASRLALQWFDQLDKGITGHGDTVADACAAYVAAIKVDRPKAATDAQGRFKRLVNRHRIGSLKVADLKAADLRTWRDEQVLAEGSDRDALRRSKDSANRNLTALKAALNQAFNDGRVANDQPWRVVTAFRDVGARRTGHLSAAQCKKLVVACDEHLARLVKAALLTGARPGELSAATVADFDKRHGSLTLTGKTGRRVIPLSRSARELFTECSESRIGKAPLLPRHDGLAWDRFYWRDAFREATKKAKLPDTVVLYTLRHTAITEMLTAGGLDVLTVARITGTSVAMIDRHYGHLVAQRTAAALEKVRLV